MGVFIRDFGPVIRILLMLIFVVGVDCYNIGKSTDHPRCAYCGEIIDTRNDDYVYSKEEKMWHAECYLKEIQDERK